MKRIYAGVFAAVGWFAIVGQFFSTPTTAGNYVSYFTILSNILVALTLTTAALAPETRPGRWLNSPPMATATALYITVTGLVYYFLLADLYDLAGWVLFFDRLLHYVVPPAYVLFWLAFVRKGTLHVGSIPWMLAAPLAYGAYTLARGPLVGWYPYPFVDVTELGYPHVFRNIVEFVIFFAFVGSIYVLIDRLIGRFRTASTS